MTTFTTRDIPPALRRKRRRIDWKQVKEDAALVAALVGCLVAYSAALMVLTGIIMMHWERPRAALTPPVSLAVTVEAHGKMTTLGAICAKAASEGALTGDLLTYCN